MRYGYGRVSRIHQDTALQLDAFSRANVSDVVTEKWSSLGKRPQLFALLARLKPGDEFVVWKLDRVGRSAVDLLKILDKIHEAGASFASLTEAIDTRTAIGRMVYTILSAVAEFELASIRERTRAGLVAAIQRGKRLGRPKVLDDEREWAVIEALLDGATQREVADRFGVSQDVVKMAWFRLVRPDHPRLRGNGMKVLGPYFAAGS